ncbi:MAG TPA: hypothetical protein VMI54_26990 [Polyangiaceae bacterium]|nr:hypothetical protein [Polyangiaceae bacterium]
MRKDAARLRQPVRLLRRSGQWSVELTRLIAVDDQLMRPERYHLAATPEVLRTLTPTCPPARVQEAEALLRSPDDGSECAFELEDGGWAPISESRPSLQPLTRGEMMGLIGELQAQVTLMRGMHDALLARIVSVEGALQPKPENEPKPAPRPLRKVPSRRDMLAVLQRPANEGPGPLALDGLRDPGAGQAATPPPAAEAAAPQASPPNAEAAPKAAAPAADPTKLAPPNPPAAPPPVAVAAEPPAPAVVAPKGNARLILPSQSEVIQCLRMLASDVEPSPHTAPAPTDFTDYYVARLVDAAQETLGAILINQRAGASLGGGLLALPVAARDDQARRGMAKDTLEGLNEVCNNVWGLVNRKNPQTATKLSALERVSGATSSWLPNAASVITLATPGGGLVYVASR